MTFVVGCVVAALKFSYKKYFEPMQVFMGAIPSLVIHYHNCIYPNRTHSHTYPRSFVFKKDCYTLHPTNFLYVVIIVWIGSQLPLSWSYCYMMLKYIICTNRAIQTVGNIVGPPRVRNTTLKLYHIKTKAS